MSVCSICGQESHGQRVCPELVLPLRDGFYRPQGGGGHSHDEDDEKLKVSPLRVPSDPQSHFPVILHPISPYVQRHALILCP